MAVYHWLRIRSVDRNWADGYKRLQVADLQGAAVWGAFYGLFGVRSNELLFVVHAEEPPIMAVTEAGFEIADRHALVPTVRPERFDPLSRSGLYVFRFFDVANKDVDEIADLSKKAWATFENTDGYSTEPKGLFRQADRSEPHGVMLLVTWYDGFDSWQASRGAAPEARENFRKRRALTQGTVAYATRLVGT